MLSHHPVHHAPTDAAAYRYARRATSSPPIEINTFRMPERAEARLVRVLATALAVILCWVGAQKFLPGQGPLEELVGDMVNTLIGSSVTIGDVLKVLGACELVLGAAVLCFPRSRLVLWSAFGFLLVGFLPFAVAPDLMFGTTPGSLTLLGQYIVKNLVLLAGLYALIEIERANRAYDVLASYDTENRSGEGWDWEEERHTGQHWYELLPEDDW